ncbi:DUF2971 domain-containing protein [Rhodococcus opacus]|uniref:DUF2971 domain-containing protein n=1 Tax=Rhodococcus opacus TaxID=37919 RepID=UPI002472FAA0|nr:DUF2971 domain-containing protein [Rhodococcus opacus]MDH6293167.1 hypothetical protein [Rhodococcus opacus]
MTAIPGDLGPSLYHYTDVNGLHGIIGSSALRATEILFMNDASEKLFGDKQIDRAFDDCSREIAVRIQNGESELARVGDAMKTMRSTLEMTRDRPDRYFPMTQQYFVACLSESRDQLSQWRAYAHEGYCIEFDTAALIEYLTTPPDGSSNNKVSTQIRRVYYGDAGLDELRGLIMQTALECAADTASTHGSSTAAHSLTPALKIATQGVFHKHQAFAEEAEVRILIPDSPSSHTPGRFGMVPRLNIPIDKNVIKSVMVGPNTYADLQEVSLRSYSLSNRWWVESVGSTGEFAVQRSDIPYRP